MKIRINIAQGQPLIYFDGNPTDITQINESAYAIIRHSPSRHRDVKTALYGR